MLENAIGLLLQMFVHFLKYFQLLKLNTRKALFSFEELIFLLPLFWRLETLPGSSIEFMNTANYENNCFVELSDLF